MFYIMSQDGGILKPIDVVIECETSPRNEQVIYCGNSHMATYKTVQDCKVAMQQLKNAIASGQHVFQFPKVV